MSLDPGQDPGMSADQRDLPPGWHAKALLASAAALLLFLAAIKYFL